MVTNGTEIERKFLVNEALLPADLSQYPQKQIMQGYLSFEPEVRIRAAKQDGVTKYYLTKKGEGTLAREEDEKAISAEEFNQKLARIGEDSFIRKTRYDIPIDNGLTAELDFFHNSNLKDYAGPHTGMHKTVEVEFLNQDDANNFIYPDWFGREVTNDKAYSNKNLAKALFQKQK